MAGLNSLMLANCLFFVDVQEVRSSVLSQSSVLKTLKYFEPCFITNVCKQFCFWWCSWGSKFCFRPKWDVRMCLKSNPLKFEVFEVRFFFHVRSTSSLYQGPERPKIANRKRFLNRSTILFDALLFELTKEGRIWP